MKEKKGWYMRYNLDAFGKPEPIEPIPLSRQDAESWWHNGNVIQATYTFNIIEGPYASEEEASAAWKQHI